MDLFTVQLMVARQQDIPLPIQQMRRYKMEIESAQYVKTFNEDGTVDSKASAYGILLVTNGRELLVPLTSGNRYYREAMRRVKAGNLTIADAE